MIRLLLVIIKNTYVSTNIKDFYEKHKSLGKNLKNELLSILVIFFVALSSFGLGILFERSVEMKTSSNREVSPQAVLGANTLKPEGQKASVINSSSAGGEVVASKSGTKYHFPWCSGAKRISEKNDRIEQ